MTERDWFLALPKERIRKVSKDNIEQPSDTSIRLIPLTKGLFATVDAGDYEWLSTRHWYAKTDSSTNYAVTTAYVDGRRKGLSMHRVIMALPALEVDHKDGDGLNNRRSNLRLADDSSNLRNQKRNSRNTSGFKGVSCEKRAVSLKWVAHINVDKRQKFLGSYKTPEEAARAYDKAAVEMFGEFARPNFKQEESL